MLFILIAILIFLITPAFGVCAYKMASLKLLAVSAFAFGLALSAGVASVRFQIKKSSDQLNERTVLLIFVEQLGKVIRTHDFSIIDTCIDEIDENRYVLCSYDNHEEVNDFISRLDSKVPSAKVQSTK